MKAKLYVYNLSNRNTIYNYKYENKYDYKKTQRSEGLWWFGGRVCWAKFDTLPSSISSARRRQNVT